jgi:endonuclease G
MRTFTLLILCLIYRGVFAQLEIPRFGKNDTITTHLGYSVSYNSRYKQANWVAYLLTRAETNKRYERGEFFAPDPLIPGTNLAVDYAKSGYDRGHLAPAADMGWSMETMVQSFFYSNMSPQLPRFNRGIWKKLEMQVRNWAIEYDSLYIVTGPIFSDSIKVIGPHRIAVPNAYYKVILDNHKGKEKMIGFIMKNEGSKKTLQSFVVNVDIVEVITDIDFFPNLEDSMETRLESLVVLNTWNWKNVKKKK